MTNESVMQLFMYLAGLVTAAIISAFIGERVKTKLAKNKKDDEDLIKMQQDERDENLKKEIIKEIKDTIKVEIREETKELKNNINDLKQETSILSQKLSVLEDNQHRQNEVLKDSRRNEIMKAFNLCVAKGYRTEWETQNLYYLYEGYKGMNGNSFIETLMEDFDDLPLREDPLLSKEESKK